jgi:asparagine synthase (glutamine-hydrolysing)
VVDIREQALWLLRDRVGAQAWYRSGSGPFRFATTLRALLSRGRSPDLDARALAGFLRFGVVPGPQSIVQGVVRVRPGTGIRIATSGTSQEVPFWTAAEHLPQAQSPGQRATRTFDELVQLVDGQMLRALRDSFCGPKPPLVFLSGGAEPLALATLATSLCSTPLRTLTIRRATAHDNDDPMRSLVGSLQTEHVEHVLPDSAIQEALMASAAIYDEPYADTAALPNLLVTQILRRHGAVAVMATGAESLGANNLHLSARRAWSWVRAVPAPVRRRITETLASGAPGRWNPLWPTLRALMPPPLRDELSSADLQRVARVIDAGSPSELYWRLASRWLQPLEAVPSADSETSSWFDVAPNEQDFDSWTLLLDLTSYLPDRILTGLSRTARHHGLTLEFPLLDHPLLELALGLPPEHRFHGGSSHAVIRTLLARRLQRTVPRHPDPERYLPLGEWLLGPMREWAEELLHPTRLARTGLLDVTSVRRLWHRHVRGIQNAERQLWPVLAFQAWRETVSLRSH